MDILLSGDAAATGAGAGGTFMLIAYFVVLIGIFYLLFYRPQKKEQKRMASLLSTVAVGDSVLTSSGFYGTIIDVTDDTVIVEFGNNKNCRIPMKKDAIVQVEKPDGAES